MKYTGYIIEKYSNMGSAYTCRRLCDEAALRGIDLRITGVRDTVIYEDGVVCGGQRLNKVDFIINRYKHGKIKHALAKLGKRQYNPQDAFELYINKYEQLKTISSEYYKKPKYCVAGLDADYAGIVNRIGEPFVMKGLESSQGDEVFLIHAPQELEKLGERFGREKEWLYEEYIADSYGRDLRLYSVRGHVIAGMIRQSQGDFRANVALGASVEGVEITPEIQCIAKDIYDQTELDFLGIDLLFGKDGLYFCEINVMPGIKGMETATGVNVAGAIMDTIMGDISND